MARLMIWLQLSPCVRDSSVNLLHTSVYKCKLRAFEFLKWHIYSFKRVKSYWYQSKPRVLTHQHFRRHNTSINPTWTKPNPVPNRREILHETILFLSTPSWVPHFESGLNNDLLRSISDARGESVDINCSETLLNNAKSNLFGCERYLLGHPYYLLRDSAQFSPRVIE
jgi:hypothetical protein